MSKIYVINCKLLIKIGAPCNFCLQSIFNQIFRRMSYVLNDQLHIFDSIRRSLLLVTPNETSFATLEETPDYYEEVCIFVYTNN